LLAHASLNDRFFLKMLWHQLACSLAARLLRLKAAIANRDQSSQINRPG
jgi:hypothetical protein